MYLDNVQGDDTRHPDIISVLDQKQELWTPERDKQESWQGPILTSPFSEETREQDDKCNIVGSDKPHTVCELEVQEVGKPAPTGIKISFNSFYVLEKQKQSGGFKQPGSNKKNVVLPLGYPPSPKWTEKVMGDYEKGKVNVGCIIGDTQKVPTNAAQNRQPKGKNKKKVWETSLDSFPVNSAPFQM